MKNNANYLLITSAMLMIMAPLLNRGGSGVVNFVEGVMLGVGACLAGYALYRFGLERKRARE